MRKEEFTLIVNGYVYKIMRNRYVLAKFSSNSL